MSEIVGVILAAGRGRRMGALGEEYPKALLPVGDRPLLAHHLGLLHRLGVRRAWVVVGDQRSEFERAIGDGRDWGVAVGYVDQGTPLGSAHAVGRVQPHVDSRFLLLLGDYCFGTQAGGEERMARRLKDGHSAMVVKHEPEPRLVREACVVAIDGDDKVLDVVEKPTVPASNLKGCGFYALQPEFFDAVRRTPRTALKDEYELSVSLDLFVKAGHSLYAEDILSWDVNLTEPRDLLTCSEYWLRQQGRQDWVAPDAKVDSGIRAIETVVGAGARVSGAARLEKVVVFPGASLEAGTELRRTLVTPTARIEC